MAFRHRHLLGLDGLDRDDLWAILDTAREMRAILDRPIKRVPTLRGVTVVNLFFESSTRTRISFELAEKRLSADTVSFTAAGSSVSKGETLRDTARNLEAMKTDVAVIRHSSPGAAHYLTRHVGAVVVNAGDGAHEHPTQGLLDMLTMFESVPKLAGRRDMRGLRVAILGDITHSRVARSNLHALRTMGADVVVCGPPTMIPPGIEAMGCTVTHRLDEALEGTDVAMALRLQLERQGAGLFPTLREYHARFGLREEHLTRHPDLRILHPGPINRGVEVSSEVADHANALVLEQVTNGVAVRMAVLYLLAGGLSAED